MSDSPTFLVAAPSLTCPFFGRSVVLLVDHDADGSFGFVVNRPALINMQKILADAGCENDPRGQVVEVVTGGPVSPQTGWVIFDPEGAAFVPEDCMQLTPNLAVTASLDMLRAIGEGKGPSRALLALGYAGWSPGQLEEELREGSWLPLDVPLDTVFRVRLEDRWDAALGGLGIDPRRVVGSGHAQA